jgi:hypothetical protein
LVIADKAAAVDELSERDEAVWNLLGLYARFTTLLLPVFEVLDNVTLFESLVPVVCAFIVEVKNEDIGA